MKTRLGVIWHVLRGHPVCYRMHFTYKIAMSSRTQNCLICECTFMHDPHIEGCGLVGTPGYTREE